MARRQYRLSLDNLRILDAIERHGSFAAAAQELCVVTSSVTHAIHNIEENLELTLFDRSGRRARFTSEGRQLLEKGRHLLAHAAEFDADVQLLSTGWEPALTLAIDQVVRMDLLMALIQAFFKEAPQTTLHVTREAVAGCWDALLGGRADLVVGAPAAGGPPGGGYETAPLFKIKFVFVVAPGHPLAMLKGVIPNRVVAGHRSVVVGDTTRNLPRLRRGLDDSRNCLFVPDTEVKLQAILQGVGCGFLPASLAEAHLKAGRLVRLRVETTAPPAQGTLAWRAGENGRALRWWIKQLSKPGVGARMFFE